MKYKPMQYTRLALALALAGLAGTPWPRTRW